MFPYRKGAFGDKKKNCIASPSHVYPDSLDWDFRDSFRKGKRQLLRPLIIFSIGSGKQDFRYRCVTNVQDEMRCGRLTQRDILYKRFDRFVGS